MKPDETWRIEDGWIVKPRQQRGRPHQSYKEAVDLYILSRAEEIYRQGNVRPMKAIQLAVNEAWESARHARLPDGGTTDRSGWLGPNKEQVVRRIRDRFRPQRVEVAVRKTRSTVAGSFPSPLEGTPLASDYNRMRSLCPAGFLSVVSALFGPEKPNGFQRFAAADQ